MRVDGIDGVEQKVRIKLCPQEIQLIGCFFFFDLFDVNLRLHPVYHHFGGDDEEYPEENIDERFVKNRQNVKMQIVYAEQVLAHKIGNGYPQPRSNYDHTQKGAYKLGVLFPVQQGGNGIQRIEIVINRYKYQVTKLYSNGTRDHQRIVPENVYPEKICQRPEAEMIYRLI